MIQTNDAVRELKRRFKDPSVPVDDKMAIIDFFKEHNNIFYSDVDIDSFFSQLMELIGKGNYD